MFLLPHHIDHFCPFNYRGKVGCLVSSDSRNAVEYLAYFCDFWDSLVVFIFWEEGKGSTCLSLFCKFFVLLIVVVGIDAAVEYATCFFTFWDLLVYFYFGRKVGRGGEHF